MSKRVKGVVQESTAVVIEHLAHYLPAQGPIGVFIHHNTLHAFEHLPFEEAVRAAADIYGAEPYMTEAKFHAEFERGRITSRDIQDVLNEEPDIEISPFQFTRTELRRGMLLQRRLQRNASEVQWWLTEGGAAESERRRLELCHRAMLRHKSPAADKPSRKQYPDVDLWMIRLCAAFVDQGVSHWPMDGRDRGFLHSVRELLAAALIEPFPGTREEARRQSKEVFSAAEVVDLCLLKLGVSPQDTEDFLLNELLALGGWAGLFHRLEKEPSLAPHEAVPCTLMDYLAVRLTLRVLDRGPAEGCAGPNVEAEQLERAAALYDALDALPSGALIVDLLGGENLDLLCKEVLAFDSLERRRIWHLAYERQQERLALSPLVARLAQNRPKTFQTKLPSAQVFFCIDDREESIRRHLEELAPDIQTFSAAGFFGVAMNYAGIDDAHGVSLCPVVVKPQHVIREKPVSDEHAGVLERRVAARRLLSRFAQSAAQATQSLWLGWISTALLGVFSLFPLLGRILAPRRFGQLRAWLNELFIPVPRTEITLMRNDHSIELNEGIQLGFLRAEKIDSVASVLAPAGLTSNFSRLVLILGHGSTSLNNPHESAYDCGACGGRRGGPNGRLFAAMANVPAVREGLRKRGILIPEDTWFLGGDHDTSSDEIRLFDVDKMPATHIEELALVEASLRKACAANALERCRRFESAAKVTDDEGGLNHVQARAEHLAEPRPEYGHSTNAVAVIGRRDLTRGLFLDRRWFLVSYDPTQDSDGVNLESLLAAAVPVCAGISLEYFFSSVDNTRYGCGTKLPHNITGLVGVMDGPSSDLRTGLTLQMVEIHEPVRILFVIEASPARIVEVVSRLPGIARLVKNRWVRVASVDPDTKEVFVLRNGKFELFKETSALSPVPNSRAWYVGKTNHLPVAQVGAVA